MADAGVFERRTRGEARAVWAGAVALCGLGWASSVWPVVPGLIFAVLVAVCAVVALRRRAARLRIARAVGEQAAREQGLPRYDEVSEVFGDPRGEPVVSVPDVERDAA